MVNHTVYLSTIFFPLLISTVQPISYVIVYTLDDFQQALFGDLVTLDVVTIVT